MPRKKRPDPLNDLLELIALLPWWVGVIFAIVSYAGLHMLATSAAPKPTDIHQLSTVMSHALLKAIATIGQYLLPAIGLIGAGVSVYRRHQRKSLLTSVADSDAADVLSRMSWQEFEMTVGEAFRLDGFDIEERGGGGADGGVDLVLRREREKFLVQCKQWKAQQVGVSIVRELYGVMAAEGAAGGFVVTSGRFTKDAIAFAEGRNVVLIDGSILFDMIKNAKSVMASNSRTMPAADFDSTQPIPPRCPTCGRAMVKRAAKRGLNAGSVFWGCVTYPACKGTRVVG